ncbi:hypothetical protein [Streptomyces sp. NPDC018584]|uniref:hypothetical protein n=1 Tax=unclassified Streptomyces TaxID=2593676 RepID=UPI0037948B6D
MTSTDNAQTPGEHITAPSEVTLQVLRDNLSDYVHALPGSGPVRVTYRKKPVAELRAAGGEHDAAEALRWRRLMLRLHEHHLLPLPELGIDTYERLWAFADRYEKLSEEVALGSPEFYLPAEGRYSEEELLALLLFSDVPPAENLVSWFETIVTLLREYAAQGLEAKLPQYYDYEDDEEDAPRSLVQDAVRHGHTPQSFLAFAREALNNDVPLARIADLMGQEPIPSDVLARKDFSDYAFDAYKEAGLEHTEVVALFRQGLHMAKGPDVRERLFGYQTEAPALLFARAGVRTAAEIQLLLDVAMDPVLALRAHQDGLGVAEWRRAVPLLAKYKYREYGPLDVRMLWEAAEQNVSLVRWDNFGPVISSRTAFADVKYPELLKRPWLQVYPERVMELARAGVSPSSVAEFAELLPKSDNFVDELLSLTERGLTSAHIKVLARRLRRREPFSGNASDLAAFLDEGMTPAQMQTCMENYGGADLASWGAQLRHWKRTQPMVAKFVEVAQGREAWDDLTAFVTHLRTVMADKGIKSYQKTKPSALTTEALSVFETPQKMDVGQLLALLNDAIWVLSIQPRSGSPRRLLHHEILGERNEDLLTSLRMDLNNYIRNIVRFQANPDEQLAELSRTGHIKTLDPPKADSDGK